MRSMTGFGRASYHRKGVACEVLIKGVNSRYTEFNFKLPPILSAMESDIRDLLQKDIRRGKVTLSVNGNVDVLHHTRLACDRAALNHYLTICRSLGLPTTGAAGQAAKWEALRVPGILKVGGLEELSSGSWRLVRQMIRTGLDSFVQFKVREGGKIRRELIAIVRKLEKVARSIAGRSVSVKAESETRVRELAKKFCNDSDALRDRIAFEISASIDRLDITEECSRLQYHLTEFGRVLSSGEHPVGRKLDFLLQEMNREINTIGAKGRDAKMSACVVEAKDLVERMREQVQNVE